MGPPSYNVVHLWPNHYTYLAHNCIKIVDMEYNKPSLIEKGSSLMKLLHTQTWIKQLHGPVFGNSDLYQTDFFRNSNGN